MKDLLCPACDKTKLQSVKEKNSQSSVGRCHKCHGMWLNAKVVNVCLQKLAANTSSVPCHAFPSQGRECPQCQVGLYEYCFPGTEVLVDACKQCNGIWLDAGEWQQIRNDKQKRYNTTNPETQAEQAASSTDQSCGESTDKAKLEQENKGDIKSSCYEHFQGVTEFIIQQETHFLETFTPIERANHYKVTLHERNDSGSYYRYGDITERSDSFLSILNLQFLGPMRAFTVTYTTREGEILLTLKKKFSFYFHELWVYGPQNKLLGKIRRKHKWVHHYYHLIDKDDNFLMEIKGPNILSVNRAMMEWDYKVRAPGNNNIALIRKQYSGLMKEVFTDSDQFNCQILQEVSTKERMLIFSAFVLIDITQFENNSHEIGSFDITSFLFDHRL